MKKNFIVAAMALSMAGIAGMPAAAQELSGDALRNEVSGKKVYLKTPYGLELPLNYQTNGSVTGDVSGFRLARMFAPKETGRWWVEGNQLCQQWPTWYEGKTSCFVISKSGSGALSWVRDDGYAGTARIEG